MATNKNRHDGHRDGAVRDGMQFVFLAMDPTPGKGALIEYLEARGIAFVDTGVGVTVASGMLGGMVRVTTGLPGRPVSGQHWISLGDATEANEYAPNIQVADLNALVATLAVIRWKKVLGFYRDLEGEQHMLYTIDGNSINNEGSA